MDEHQELGTAGHGPGLSGRRTLLLASSGLQTVPLLRAMMPTMQGHALAFLPQASYADRYGVVSRLMRQCWQLAGFDVHVIDLTGDHTHRVRDELEACDAIYVCGGNSFYLMRCLRDSGAVPTIRSMVGRGVPYVGESAGAVVACRTIGYIAPMDENVALPGHAHPRGLGLTAYHVVPHVSGVMLGDAARTILERHADDPGFVGLRNDQVLVVRGASARVTTSPVLTPLAWQFP